MLGNKQLVLMAEYNQLMNHRQYAAAAKLSVADLYKDNGAFFKSVFGTLNHILVGDIVWLTRFAEHPSSRDALSMIVQLKKPKSLDELLYREFSDLKAAREKIDETLITWVGQLSESDLDKGLSYANMAGQRHHKLMLSLITHLFLHQVHHRGQVTTLLSQYGVDFGETDLLEIISECEV